MSKEVLVFELGLKSVPTQSAIPHLYGHCTAYVSSSCPDTEQNTTALRRALAFYSDLCLPYSVSADRTCVRVCSRVRGRARACPRTVPFDVNLVQPPVRGQDQPHNRAQRTENQAFDGVDVCAAHAGAVHLEQLIAGRYEVIAASPVGVNLKRARRPRATASAAGCATAATAQTRARAGTRDGEGGAAPANTRVRKHARGHRRAARGGAAKAPGSGRCPRARPGCSPRTAPGAPSRAASGPRCAAWAPGARRGTATPLSPTLLRAASGAPSRWSRTLRSTARRAHAHRRRVQVQRTQEPDAREQRIARALCSRSWFLRLQVCGVGAGPDPPHSLPKGAEAATAH